MAVFGLDYAGPAPKLGVELGSGDWRPRTTVCMPLLPALPAAVAVVLVDGAEWTRSGPFVLNAEPALVAIDVRGAGTIEVDAVVPPGGMVFAQVLAHDGQPILRGGAGRLRPDRPFRCVRPAGSYVVRVTTSASGAERSVDLPCVVEAGRTTTLRVR